MCCYLCSAGQEEPKQNKTVDLFGGGDEDGNIFSESSGVLPPLQSRREVVEEEEQVNIHTCTEHCFYLYCIRGLRSLP
jgi:hypothetical protein